MIIDNLTYIINLQRAIEYHCMGLLVPDDVMSECPHHAEMLNLQLYRQQQQESRPTTRGVGTAEPLCQVCLMPLSEHVHECRIPNMPRR